MAIDYSSEGIDAQINDIAGLGSSGFLTSLLGPLAGIGTVAGGALATNSAYDRLSSIGDQSLVGTTISGKPVPGAMDLANQAVGMSQFKPFTVTSSTGSQFGATPTMDAQGNITGTNVYNTLGGTEQLDRLRQALQAVLREVLKPLLLGWLLWAVVLHSLGKTLYSLKMPQT
jgi:hypothetical protein